MTAPTYLPWVRAGLVAAVTNPDPLSGALPSRTTMQVTGVVAPGSQASVAVTVLGPGDVTAVDPRFVTRSEPQDGAIEVEPNYFCAAELPAPDLPWMLTPAAPNADRLRPSVVLVVVRADACSLDLGSADRLPTLHVQDVSAQLPDLAQSHAWAHAQVDSLAALTASARPVGLARLLCPRLLEPKTRYVAAVVPAFEPGRLAGLGLPVPSAATMQPAWDVAVAGSLDLPSYHAWTFTTGDDGDFEALVTRLQRVALSGDTAAGRVAVIDQQAGLPPLTGWRFPGALGGCPDPSAGAAFEAALAALVDSDTASAAAGLSLPPPLYGRRHAVEATLTGSTKPWLRRLNLDPRYRSAAALGTRLVQEHQEALMAAAWSQIGQVETANALLRQAQLARSAGSVLHTRLGTLNAAALVLVAGPLLVRVLDPGTATTLRAQVVASRVPVAMLSGAFRRATRPRGPLGRRSGGSAAALLSAVDGGLPVVAPRGRPGGLVTIDQDAPVDAPDWCRLTPQLLVERAKLVQPPATKSQWVAMVKALVEAQRDNPPCEFATTVRDRLNLEATRVVVLEATDPRTTVPSRIGTRVSGPPGWAPADPLMPILAAPRIDTPLARDLVALSSDLLLPGVSSLPLEAVSAVAANPRFIEALMVGANEEMMRELLWRGYPTDLRGTPLRRFWDRSGSVAGPVDDLPSIDETWAGELGTHLDAALTQVVLVVRGEVLRRYPDTVIYAARARWDGDRRVPVAVTPSLSVSDPTYPERYPAFSGTLPPDVSYVGFDLPEDARGDAVPAAGRPGWFFVFQQPAAANRFGLDATRSQTSPGQGAADLSWPAVATTASGHVNLAGPLSDLDLPGWGLTATSADLAVWCEQKPFRVCIHASDLLPAVQP